MEGGSDSILRNSDSTADQSPGLEEKQIQLQQTESIEEEKVSKRLVGLSNQGATCYMNSFLSALYMTKEFRKALYEWR